MKIMTREEAVELELEFVKADASVLGSSVTKAKMRGLAECNVNRYVAFGMLELKDDPIAMAQSELDIWIEREFAGRGVAIRTKNEPRIPGEPLMSMAMAKYLTRAAVAKFTSLDT